MPYDNQPKQSLLSGLRTQQPAAEDAGYASSTMIPQADHSAQNSLDTQGPFSEYPPSPGVMAMQAQRNQQFKERQRQENMERARRVAQRGSMQMQADQRVQSKSAGY